MRLQWSLFTVLVANAAAGLVPRQETTTATPTGTTTASTSVSVTNSPTASTTSTSATGNSATPVASGTSTSSTSSDGTSTTAASPTSTNVQSSGDQLVCSNTDGKFKPFCTPNTDRPWYVGDRYNVSWDPAYYGKDTLQVLITYNEVQPGAGVNAWESSQIPANESHYFITVDKGWLQKKSSNNVTIKLLYNRREPDVGPTIIVTNKPPPPSEPPKPRPLGVLIGVPIAVAVLLFMSICVCVSFRKNRQIGLGNIMGRRRGYATRKSKRERLRDKGAIRMEALPVENRASNEWEVENVRGDVYHDEPRNAFRDEMARQNAT